MKGKIFLFLVAFLFPFYSVQSQHDELENRINAVRDSLDAIIYPIPEIPKKKKYDVVLKVKTQKDWDDVVLSLEALLKEGKENIIIKVIGINLEFGKEKKYIQGWYYPNANIRFDGNKAKMIPFGYTFSWKDTGAKREGEFYSLPYSEFNLNDIVIDSKGNEIPLREEVRQVDGDIEKVQNDIWRFKIDLPELTEEQCKDFYVLLTRDWTSARHKVVKVEDGWLYYHLESDDLHSERNPNVDWENYRVRPRYSLINNPYSNGIHVVDGRIFIPNKYKTVRINKGGQLITFVSCTFKSLEICGFKLNGCAKDTPVCLFYNSFIDDAYIYNNNFSNLSSLAINSAHNSRVAITHNTINNSRIHVIEAGGKRTSVNNNYLSNIGWMKNSMAILGGGDSLIICDNIIEDFNYCAIASGNRTATKDSILLNYIIERNVIKLSENFSANYLKNTLADGGGIYLGPSCTQGVIRNNVIIGMKGIDGNRGIFLDDGTKNVSIYGNLIMNTENCFDIDLRYDNTFAKDIPDHNTHNNVFNNIMTGGYRFQDAGFESYCIGGQNLLLGMGPFLRCLLNISNNIGDMEIKGGKYNRGKIAIPVEYVPLLDRMHVDSFVKDFIIIK